MDRQMLDRIVPIVFAAVLIASALFFRSALAATAIFGAVVLAAYYIAIKPKLIAMERGRDADETEDGFRDRLE